MRSNCRSMFSLFLLSTLGFLITVSSSTHAQLGGIKWDPVDDVKNAGGAIAKEGKEGLRKAGQQLEKPFRHLGENAKEAVFFEMRNHVVSKNNQLGNGGTRFLPSTKYYQYIQPHLPRGMDFSNIIWHFNAYVPAGQTGITFGNHVYIDWDYNQFHPQYLALMAHETGHVIQYERWGTKGFARKYVDDSFGSWTKYPNFNQVKIHDDMAIEREAEQFAQNVMNGYHAIVQANQARPPQQSPGSWTPQQSTNQGNNHYPPQQQPNWSNNNGGGRSEGEMIAGLILQGIGQAIQQERQQTQERRMRPQIPNQHVTRRPKLGLNVQSVPGRGAFVTSVSPGKAGQRAGIEVNDYIVSIDGQRVYTAQDVLRVLRDRASTGKQIASVLVENHRLNHLPIEQRYSTVEVKW